MVFEDDNATFLEENECRKFKYHMFAFTVGLRFSCHLSIMCAWSWVVYLNCSAVWSPIHIINGKKFVFKHWSIIQIVTTASLIFLTACVFIMCFFWVWITYPKRTLYGWSIPMSVLLCKQIDVYLSLYRWEL